MLLAAAAALGADLCLVLLLPFGRPRRRRRALVARSVGAALAGAAVALGVGAVTGASSTVPRAVAIALAGAGLVFGLLELGPGSRIRRLVALVAVASTAVAAVGMLTAPPSAGTDGRLAASTAPAARPTWGPHPLRSGPGYPHLARWRIDPLPASAVAPATPSRLAHGEVGSVVIPATRSHFRARPAIVYLPPAALGGHPPRLPVVIALSGQSHAAGPLDVVTGGRIASIMDAIAARHHGVAPIVVIPDQLGPKSANPMCLDSPLGHVATYITQDVRGWILTHLPAATDRKDWTIAGFSEGGTCSIQFGAAHPDLFGSLVDVSGEHAPVTGTVAHTIRVAFGGDARAYAAAAPAALLHAHRYRDMRAYFCAGQYDTHYGPVAPVMARLAHAAGMTTTYRRLPGLHHNWLTGHAGLLWGLDALQTWWPAETVPVLTHP